MVLALMGLLAFWRRRPLGKGISILIPFRCNDPHSQRARNMAWVRRYWAAQLPKAEIIIGEDPEAGKPFSKSAAVNNAAAKASGDVLVIVDADGYIKADRVLHCAEEIRRARRKGKPLWFVPYRQFYRLTKEASQLLLDSDPADPYEFSTPPDPWFLMRQIDPKLGTYSDDPKVAHWYGAMIQIMPREAFEAVGGWDTRFRGWGGEDHAAMRAMDTLYAMHKTLPSQVLHIWHPQIGPSGTKDYVHWRERMWEGQLSAQANEQLSNRYYGARGNPEKMRALLDESRS